MITYDDPDGSVTEYQHTPCPFHQKYPDIPYAGCCCSSVIYTREATPEERQEKRRRRLEREREIQEAYAEFGNW